MFEKYLWLVIPIAIAIYPLPVVIVFLVTGDFVRACFFTMMGEFFLAVWLGAMSFLFDVFKELKRKREKRKKADGDV